jgi:hypothetical protein
MKEGKLPPRHSSGVISRENSIAEFESLGETEVRRRVYSGAWISVVSEWAEDWMRLKGLEGEEVKAARLEDRSARQEARSARQDFKSSLSLLISLLAMMLSATAAMDKIQDNIAAIFFSVSALMP